MENPFSKLRRDMTRKELDLLLRNMVKTHFDMAFQGIADKKRRSREATRRWRAKLQPEERKRRQRIHDSTYHARLKREEPRAYAVRGNPTKTIAELRKEPRRTWRKIYEKELNL